MSVTSVVGAQWGDEAKGKIVDLLSDEADIVARFNGGDNAGHTVVNSLGTFKLRLIPSGSTNPKTTCVIGPGVVVNLATLNNEMQMLLAKGIPIQERLWVSPRCNVVMPYHPLLEAIYETAKGASQTGTTRRGMGPVYADKVSYNGIRLYDLADREVFAEKLRIQLSIKNPLLQAFGYDPLNQKAVEQEILDLYTPLAGVVREAFGLLQDALHRNANLVLEGAQAALLDNDWGTYPFCTASNTLAGGAAAGLGIAPRWISRVIGVSKAYTTRVGGGPMPTELHDAAGETLLKAGQEFGTVTGRPRRCGWLDANLVHFTAQLNGYTELALTKLDVLDGLPEIKVCIGYRRGYQGAGSTEDGPVLDYWQGDARWLETVEPVYITLDGWQRSTKAVRSFTELPDQAQEYVRKVEELVGVPVSIVSVGPGRDEIIRVPGR